jgi:hypothetical protein
VLDIWRRDDINIGTDGDHGRPNDGIATDNEPAPDHT